jgi:hypothetical protein
MKVLVDENILSMLVMNAKRLRKTHSAKSESVEFDDLLPEYKFDYSKAKPNRFAERVYKNRRVVILDADISKVFTSTESVNAVLRALIATMPKAAKAKSKRKPSRRSLLPSRGVAAAA